jgi:methyl halide transferase
MVLTPDKTYTVDDKEFWERLYQAKTIPWELNAPAPPLKTFTTSPYMVPPGSMAVLGCGSGHDCMLFANKGFQVTGIDFAPSAIQSTYQKFLGAGFAGKSAFLLERDVFSVHEYDRYFDYVLEHNFFSSIHPSRRRTYNRTVHDLLKPGGKLIALWWVEDKPGGPPFGIPKDALWSLFGDYFTFDIVFQPNNSAKGREGHELFTLMTAK